MALGVKDTVAQPLLKCRPDPNSRHEGGSLVDQYRPVAEEVGCRIMTDTSSLPTHSTGNILPVTASPLLPSLPNGNNVPKSALQDDGDEPYTIKCICAFVDDDGSTVFCERCETWQHIVCYYDDQEVPDVHNCADCEPRALDGKRATERQRQLREQSDAGDRKGRRSGSKTQKKKTKDASSSSEQQQQQHNGWVSHERSGSNSTVRDNPPPTKKPRTNHRHSGSMSSSSGAPLLVPDNRRRRATSASNSASPTKSSSLPQIPLYSQEFLHLYDNDRPKLDMAVNLLEKIGLARDLADWVHDPSTIAHVANGRNPKDIFIHLDEPLNPATWPAVSAQTKTDSSIDCDGKHPTWRFIKVENEVRKDEIVGEVRGKVGYLQDYCLDPNSRWQELRHPEPFVFFHPQLPLYIDSRQEGTPMRYIRRSCVPNVTLKTFVVDEVDCHFCFVANQNIPAGSELTATWYLDPQLFSPINNFTKQGSDGLVITESAAISISNVLAHFGGCACSSTNTCSLSNLDRRKLPKGWDTTAKSQNGRRRRNKSKPALSPVSTGRTANSRSGSEIVRAQDAQDDDDHGENRSTSGSVRDDPGSRDITPTGHSPNSALGASNNELSLRERRKIAAVEKKFERLEQDQHQTQKRKKRTSAQSSNVSSTLQYPKFAKVNLMCDDGLTSTRLHL